MRTCPTCNSAQSVKNGRIDTGKQRFLCREQYKAPLKTVYATCVGQAKASEDYPYQLQFGKGNVAFEVKLPPDTPANPSEIMEKSILGARPYVKWAIAD